MKSYAVIGLGFGNEGKGMFTDLLASRLHNPVIVRFSGGHSVSHTVYMDDEEFHVFSNFGSGSFRGAPTFWSRYCTIEPVGMLKELNTLETKNLIPVLHIDPSCPVTTPFEILHANKIAAELPHGCCDMESRATWKRESDHYSLTFGDIFYPSVLKLKMEQIQKYYGVQVPLEDFFTAVQILAKHDFIRPAYESIIQKYNSVIFEGSHGLLLDRTIGFFPHVSCSNTGTANILAMGYEPFVFLVSRAYQTRHSDGPMTNENIAHSIRLNTQEKIEDETRHVELRRSILDLDLLQYAIQKDPYLRETPRKSLVITCLDLLDDFMYSLKDNVHKCNHMQQFVEEIQRYLKFEEAFGTASPLPGANYNIMQRLTEFFKELNEASAYLP